MIFFSEMSASLLRMRPCIRKLRMRRAKSQGLIPTSWLKCLASIFLLLASAAPPLYGQSDLALQASELMQAGKFHGAELLWRQLAQQHPQDALIHGNLGVALARQGKLEPATAEYRKSLALKPDQPDVTFNLGIAEFKQGHFSAAIPAFERLGKEKPEDPPSTILLGIGYFGLCQCAKADHYLQNAIQKDSSNLDLHNVLPQSSLWTP